MKKRIHFIFIFVFIFFTFAEAGTSTKNNSQCTFNTKTQELLINEAITPFPIASVSKVITSYWAISQLGAQYRYPHQLYITALDKNIVDVHIAGSLYPYFDRTFFQYLIAQLNLLGIYQINTLTYDENFEYSSIVRTNSNLAHQNHDPDSTEIMRSLRSDLKQLNSGYSALKAKSKALDQTEWPTQLKMTIKDIHYISKSDFQPVASTQVLTLFSSPLYRLLKEMNRNSNNFAADKVFEKLSQTNSFETFIRQKFSYGHDDIDMRNGSGYPIMIDQEKFYNKASCEVVLKVLSSLTNLLKQQNLGLQDVLSVAGADSAADGASTVTTLYSSTTTDDSLLAKTGTVAQSVSLAGQILTAAGPIFFHTAYQVQDNPNSRRIAYNGIKQWIENLIKKYGKVKLDNYNPKGFLPFDKNSTPKKNEPPKLM